MVRGRFDSVHACTILGSIPAFATFDNVGASISLCSPCCNSLCKVKSRSCDSDRCTVMAMPECSSKRHFRLAQREPYS